MLSGAALLVLGSMAVWSALADAEARAQLETRRATIATAEALREAVREPRVLELVDAARRFAVAESGELIVPDAVRDSYPVEEAPEADLPVPLQVLLERIRAGEGDVDAQFEELHASPLLSEAQKVWIAIMRGFRAERAGDAGLRDAMLDWVERAEGGFRRDVAGAVLLAVRAGRTPPAWAVARIGEIDPAVVPGLVTSLRGVEAQRGLADEIEARHGHLAQQRRVLEAVAPHLPRLDDARDAVAYPVRGELLLYFPSEAVGVLADPVDLVERMRAADSIAPVPWTGSVVVAGADDAAVSADAEAAEGVFADVSLAPPRPQTAGWDGPVGLAVIGAALALCFCAGLVLTLRALRAESAATRAHAEFLQSVTHELKTPLASIRLLAERLESGRVTDPQKRDGYYTMLADEAQRLSVLIENVLDLGRIERGERSYDRRRQDLLGVVEEAVEVFGPLAQRDGIRVVVERGDPADATAATEADVDRGAIVQALLNVLENARKYAVGGTRIVVRCARAAEAPGQLAIDVRDFGPGVPADEQAMVFERFHRGARHRDGSIAGVGLGLHLARSIVRAHGGDLACRSPEDGGAGAVFAFRLPLAAPMDGAGDGEQAEAS